MGSQSLHGIAADSSLLLDMPSWQAANNERSRYHAIHDGSICNFGSPVEGTRRIANAD